VTKFYWSETMADEKISAMPAASFMANADDMPILRLGANNKISRNLFMVAGPAEAAAWQNSSGGWVGLNIAGNALVTAAAGASATMSNNALSGQVTVNVSGAVNGVAAMGQTMSFMMGMAGFMINAAGHTSLLDTSGASCFVTFVATGAGNWMGVPNNLATAIDRLAAALVARTAGGPIP
jgi:hypothetical protein